MSYKKTLGLFKKKIHLNNVENIKLSDGKVEINFFKTIVKSASELCLRVEFDPESRNAWRWNPNATVGNFATLLSASATTAAKHRAEIISPHISRKTVKSYLADILERPVESIDESAPVSSMTLSVCAHQPKSYITVLCWLEKTFNKQSLPEKGTIGELLDYMTKD